MAPQKSYNILIILFKQLSIRPKALHPATDDSHRVLHPAPRQIQPACICLRRPPFWLPSSVSGTSGSLLMLHATSTLFSIKILTLSCFLVNLNFFSAYFLKIAA